MVNSGRFYYCCTKFFWYYNWGMGFLCMDFWSDLLIFVFVWILKCNGFRMFKAARSHQLRLCLARALVAEQAGIFGGILRQSVDQETWETLPIQKPMALPVFPPEFLSDMFPNEHKLKRTKRRSPVEIHFQDREPLEALEQSSELQDPAGKKGINWSCCPWQPMAMAGAGISFVMFLMYHYVSSLWTIQCNVALYFVWFFSTALNFTVKVSVFRSMSEQALSCASWPASKCFKYMWCLKQTS